MNMQVVKAQNLLADARERLAEKAEDEQGDGFSYLVLVIGLVAAAAAARGPLEDIIRGLLGKIATDSGSGVTVEA